MGFVDTFKLCLISLKGCKPKCNLSPENISYKMHHCEVIKYLLNAGILRLSNYANESYLETFLHHSCDKYQTFTINRQICTYVNNCTIVAKCITIDVKSIVSFTARRSTIQFTNKSIICISKNSARMFDFYCSQLYGI